MLLAESPDMKACRLTKAQLNESFQSGIDGGYTEVSVYISMPDLPDLEVIVNTRANFEKKLEYYNRAYNDDCELITFPAIHICNIVMSKR